MARLQRADADSSHVHARRMAHIALHKLSNLLFSLPLAKLIHGALLA
jgi:hypothetical protein